MSDSKNPMAWLPFAIAEAALQAGAGDADLTQGWSYLQDRLRESGARDAGKLRAEGKAYVVKDGDVMHFLFNV